MRKIVIIIAVIFGLLSCGSRKTNKSKTKDESKSKIEVQAEVMAAENSKVENNISENKSTATESNSEEKENHMKPVDPSKPMKKTETTDGNTKITTWENAEVIEKSKKEDSKKTEDSQLNDKSVITSGSTFEGSAELKRADERTSEKLEKNTEAQKGFSLWWFLLLIIPIGYYLLKKYKIIL